MACIEKNRCLINRHQFWKHAKCETAMLMGYFYACVYIHTYTDLT